MALTLEEIKKLPPRERIRRLREFEEEQKRRKEEEEKNRKKAEEEIIKKSIEEITEEDEKKEEEEKKTEELEKEEKEKKQKQESLENIAEEAKPNVQQKNPDYLEQQQAYVSKLSRVPTAELYQSVNSLRERRDQRGYLTQREIDEAQNLRGAFAEKERAGYNPGEKGRIFMDSAEKTLEEINNPIKKTMYK